MKKYGIDSKGFIITEVGLRKVNLVFKEVLVEIKNEIIDEFGDKIDSLYLYGSVATGKARVKSSDLDLLLVFKRKPTLKLKNEIAKFQNYLTIKYLKIFREVGISLTSVKEVKKDIYGWGCFVKHLCVCLHGRDFGKSLPKFKPSKKIAKAFNGDIEKHIKVALEKLNLMFDPREVYSICSGSMRKIVRTGFCLVMEREQSWTTNLKKSCDVFSKYYPKQSANMKKALFLAQRPTANKKDLEKIFKNFGGWLVDEAKIRLG